MITISREEFEKRYGKISPQVSQPGQTLGQKLGETVKSRFTDTLESVARLQSGEQGFGSTVLQTAGNIAGGLTEAAMQTVGAGVGEVAKATGIAEPAKKLGLELLQTSIGQQALKALGSGVESYDKWKAKNPTIAENIEAVIDVASFIPVAKTAETAVKGTIAGAKALGTGVAKLPTLAKGTTAKLVTKVAQKAEAGISKNVDDLISSKKSLTNAVKLVEQKKRTPLTNMLKDTNVYKGLKVEKGTINPDSAIEFVQSRIDKGMEVAKSILPMVDEYAKPISKNTLRSAAESYVKSEGLLPGDEKSILSRLYSQLDELPDEFLPSELDALRASAREGARTAQGLLKPANEYAALENAARDLMFQAADQLPSAAGGEFAKLRTFIKQNIDLSTFLDKTLRGQKVAGGRLGQYTGRIIGAAAGSSGGPFVAIVGQELGAKLADILMNNQLGSAIKMRMVRGLTDNPQALKVAEELLRKQSAYIKPMLGAGTSPTINLPAKAGKLSSDYIGK